MLQSGAVVNQRDEVNKIYIYSDVAKYIFDIYYSLTMLFVY